MSTLCIAVEIEQLSLLCTGVSMKLMRLLFLRQKVIIFHPTLKNKMSSPKLCLAVPMMLIKNVM